MISEYTIRKQVEAMNQAEREALPRVKNDNGSDYASCPRCRHYHAMMPAQLYTKGEGHFLYNYCRDCGEIAVVVN